MVIERFLAGTMIPANCINAHRPLPEHLPGKDAELFKTTDILLAPATPCPAIPIGQATITPRGVSFPSRPNARESIRSRSPSSACRL